MKKIIIVLLLMIGAVPSFSQTSITKSEVVWRKGLMGSDVIYSYKTCDEDNNCSSPIFELNGKNWKYEHIVDIITIYEGTPAEMYDFFTKLEEFRQKYKGSKEEVSTKIGNRTVDLTWGGVRVYSEDLLGY